MTSETFQSYYVIVLVIITVVSAWIGIAAWRRRQSPGAIGLAVMMAGEAWWAGCYALQLSNAVRPEPLFWSNLMLLGTTVIPASFLIFSLQYTNRGSKVTRRLVEALMIEPILVNIGIWTDRYHGLFTAGYQGGANEVFTGGIIFWNHTIYSYILLIIGGIMLLIHWLNAPPMYRRQAFLILLGLPLALITNVMTIFQINPWPGLNLSPLDLSPLGFSLCGMTLALALFRYRLFDLVPIAHEAIIQRMTDGLIILDVDQRVLDLNPRAQEFLGWQAKAKEALGLDIRTLLPWWDKMMAHYEREKEFRQEITLENPVRRHVDLRITDLYDSNNRLRGVLIVLRDITDRKLVEEEKSLLLEQTQQDALIKTELLKEINHRVKNNLMAIIGLLLNEKSQTPEAGKPFVNTAIDNLTRRIDGLLQVHQMLSDTQWAPMSLTELADSIIKPVIDTAPPDCRIELVVQPSPIKVSPRQANNLALLFNELATNTVKYALSQNSAIKIHCRADRQDDMIVIEYRDSGPGYPPGVLSGRYGNIGLSLVRQLVTQTLRGDLLLSNDGGAVTTMHIRIEDTKST